MGFQSYIFWRLISQMHVLEAGMPHVVFETLFYKEKLQVLSSHHAGGGVYGKTVSQTLLPSSMWFSSHLPRVSFSLNQPLGFYEKTVPYRLSVSRGGREFRISLHYHLKLCLKLPRDGTCNHT